MRRSSGSSSVIFRSGRTSASGIPGQPGARTHVADRHTLGHHLGEHRAVQQVALPQARHLARADQPALDARVGEQLRVPDSLREALTEYRPRLLGRLGELRCLRHGDRPSVPR